MVRYFGNSTVRWLDTFRKLKKNRDAGQLYFGKNNPHSIFSAVWERKIEIWSFHVNHVCTDYKAIGLSSSRTNGRIPFRKLRGASIPQDERWFLYFAWYRYNMISLFCVIQVSYDFSWMRRQLFHTESRDEMITHQRLQAGSYQCVLHRRPSC